jgi:hypothetical protein
MTGKRAVDGWGQGQNPEYTTSVTSGLCESGCEDRKGNRGRFQDPIAGGVSDLYSVRCRATGDLPLRSELIRPRQTDIEG